VLRALAGHLGPGVALGTSLGTERYLRPQIPGNRTGMMLRCKGGGSRAVAPQRVMVAFVGQFRAKQRSERVRRIMVGVKRVVDYNVRIRVKPDNTGVVTEGVKMSINPFDEIALEEALRIKEKGLADEVLAVSIGPSDTQQQLRTALAMGADRAILVQTDASLGPISVARIFHKIAEAEQPFLVIVGKQAIDEDNGQTAQMLAAMLDRPQAVSCSKVEIADGKATVTREVDAGLEVLEIELPAVLSVDLRLNEPRYVKLPDIMKAKKKPLDVKTVAEFGVPETGAFKVVKIEPPPTRSKGIIVKDVAELIGVLQQKGLV
jgi:electron transfer flavoprotein beta subunit